MIYKFIYFYKKNGLTYNPLNQPTLKILNTSGSVLAENISMANISPGVYVYNFETLLEDDYIGISYTSDITVDEQNLLFYSPKKVFVNMDEKISKPKNISEESIVEIANRVFDKIDKPINILDTEKTIMFVGRVLDELLNAQGFLGSSDGQYEKIAKETINQ